MRGKSEKKLDLEPAPGATFYRVLKKAIWNSAEWAAGQGVE